MVERNELANVGQQYYAFLLFGGRGVKQDMKASSDISNVNWTCILGAML